MRNLDRKGVRPRATRSVGITAPSGRERGRGTEPERHFTPVATVVETPPRVFVDLEPYGEREVIDGRD